MIVACHQPDLLPYSGFFYKLAKADVFDLRIYDQYLKSGYQRRVKMREQWANVPVGKLPVETRIKDVIIDSEEAVSNLLALIHGRYSGSAHYKTRGAELREFLVTLQGTDHLWQFNLELIIFVRDMLGIPTPIAINHKPYGQKNDSLVNLLQSYSADTYLSGTGARAYMGDCHEFDEAGIKVVWSAHKPVTGDSILSVVMDYDDPLEVVMREEESA